MSYTDVETYAKLVAAQDGRTITVELKSTYPGEFLVVETCDAPDVDYDIKESYDYIADAWDEFHRVLGWYMWRGYDIIWLE